jgi:hypothetical protein
LSIDPITPPPKLNEKMEWYEIAPKSMLAGALILFAGVIGGLFARLEGKSTDEMINLKKAVDQAENNYRTRQGEQLAATVEKVSGMEKSMVQLTDAVQENTKVNGKVLQELARINGVLAAKGIDR